MATERPSGTPATRRRRPDDRDHTESRIEHLARRAELGLPLFEDGGEDVGPPADADGAAE